MSWRWLALGEDALPADEHWLAPGEAATLARLRFTKRRTEYLLRRLVAKHAVAAVMGRSTDPTALASIEIRNAPSGAPYVCTEGTPLGVEVSITDRAGWAVCVTWPSTGKGSGAEPGSSRPVGCDLELVEPRTPGFVLDFLTTAEQRFVASRPAGEERDLAANLIWSAKESALKVLRTGLRRDTRSVEVTLTAPRGDGWGELRVGASEGTVFRGWWRREGRFLLTVATEATAAAAEPPVALRDPGVLAAAQPRHSWVDRPLHR